MGTTSARERVREEGLRQVAFTAGSCMTISISRGSAATGNKAGGDAAAATRGEEPSSFPRRPARKRVRSDASGSDDQDHPSGDDGCGGEHEDSDDVTSQMRETAAMANEDFD